MLQETHVKSESQNHLRSIWGYNCFTCGHSTASKGVAILFNNTFTYKIHNILRDDNGSFLILDITIFEDRITLANIYGPSERDEPDYFDKIFQIIERMGNRQVVTGGDWNVILNPELDARNYRSYNPRPRSRQIIKDKMEQLELVDIYIEKFFQKKELILGAVLIQSSKVALTIY